MISRRGLAVGALQGVLLLAIAGQLLLDQASRPRGWARTEPVDPSLPIRGRYIDLRLVVPMEPSAAAAGAQRSPLLSGFQMVRLSERNRRLVARPAGDRYRDRNGSGLLAAQMETRNGIPMALLQDPLAFFLPEHAADPSQRRRGEELWVEVTLPAEGTPRPIRLGVKATANAAADAAIVPLNLR
ncbi:MAG: hypothetical protein ACK55H_13010 [Cyanobacteriota bacterium]|jgi:hypothetical protein